MTPTTCRSCIHWNLPRTDANLGNCTLLEGGKTHPLIQVQGRSGWVVTRDIFSCGAWERRMVPLQAMNPKTNQMEIVP